MTGPIPNLLILIPALPLAAAIITALLGRQLKESAHVPVVVALVAALAGRGYPVRFAEVRDAHNWVCWRDALDPYLVDLLQAVS